MAVSVNTRSAFSLLFPPILAEMHWDRSTTAAAFSIGFLASAFFAPAVGICLDKIGPRFVIPAAALLVATGLYLTTFAQTPLALYLSYGVMVVGASVSVSYMGHGAFLPNWFERKRGLALGIAFSGVGFGAIGLFPWLQQLIDGPGWRDACIALAILVVVIVVPLNLIFQRTRPSDLGLHPDGDSGVQNRAAQADNIVDVQWAETEWTLARALATARFWWLFAATCCALFVWYAVLIHQTRYLLDVGFSSTEAALALGLVPFCGLVGQVSIGHFSDRIGREWGWTVCCAGFAICYLALLGLATNQAQWLLYVVIGAQGLLGYGLPILISAIPAELFAGRHFGAVFGALSVSAAIGPSSGPWITGWMFDYFGDYTAAFWLGIGLCFVSTFCIWMSAPRRVRRVAGQVRRGVSDT
jgi:MFS family permease